jgi:hypothetical protein
MITGRVIVQQVKNLKDLFIIWKYKGFNYYLKNLKDLIIQMQNLKNLSGWIWPLSILFLDGEQKLKDGHEINDFAVKLAQQVIHEWFMVNWW